MAVEERQEMCSALVVIGSLCKDIALLFSNESSIFVLLAENGKNTLFEQFTRRKRSI
jgi:hypothetical protein